MLRAIKSWSNDLVRVLFPAYCPGCKSLLVQGEAFCCLACEAQLPYTGHHLSDRKQEVMALFDGRVAVAGAIALLYFNKQGVVREIIHEMKYGGQFRTAKWLGIQLGDQIDQPIDAIVPVPMHPDKIRKRGYNQSVLIAEGAAQAIGSPVKAYLSRHRKGGTQTEMNRYERWQAMQGLYTLSRLASQESLAGMRILLVDDILTTGVTLEYCVNVLQETGAIVYIAVLGFGERL